jgi:hypothetical protein
LLAHFLINSFEKWQELSAAFQCINYVKRGLVLCCLQKSLANSKGLGVKRLRTY